MIIQMLYVTFPNRACAQKIGQDLLNEKLIACYNLLPIESAYWWEGTICSEDEIVGIMKTTKEATTYVEKEIAQQHPYDTPCIIHWEVQANTAYAEWVKSSVDLGN